jgi:hypothetical protein
VRIPFQFQCSIVLKKLLPGTSQIIELHHSFIETTPGTFVRLKSVAASQIGYVSHLVFGTWQRSTLNATLAVVWKRDLGCDSLFQDIYQPIPRNIFFEDANKTRASHRGTSTFNSVLMQCLL